MRRLIVLTALLVMVAAACDLAVAPEISVDPDDHLPGETLPVTTPPPGPRAVVVSALDGDSLVVRLDGEEREVRLLGINAPERNECLGDASRRSLEALVADRAVTLVTGDDDEVDQFGRLLRYVFVDDAFVNRTMIESGHALATQSGHPREAEFLAAEDEAIRAEAGIWNPAACGPPPPERIVIAEVHYDAEGRDDQNPDGEWVTIVNQGAETIGLGGWVLRDESSRHRFVFPDDVEFGPGDEVRIRSGCTESADPADLAWCAGDPVWSNGGDTALLLDRNGNVAAWHRYPGDF